MIRRAVFDGPLGRLALTEEAGVITQLRWDRAAITGEGSALLSEACAQLGAYFEGRLRVFDLPLVAGEGTQARILAALRAIAWGETRTYGDLARDLGLPAQRVGQGCGANPVPVLIPCHRVLGANGIGGFSAPGGVETKVALLKLEGAASLLI